MILWCLKSCLHWLEKYKELFFEKRFSMLRITSISLFFLLLSSLIDASLSYLQEGYSFACHEGTQLQVYIPTYAQHNHKSLGSCKVDPRSYDKWKNDHKCECTFNQLVCIVRAIVHGEIHPETIFPIQIYHEPSGSQKEVVVCSFEFIDAYQKITKDNFARSSSIDGCRIL